MLVLTLLIACQSTQAEEPATSILEVDRIHADDADAPSPEDVIDADTVVISPAGEGDAVFDEVVTTGDVLLSEVLKNSPLTTEERILIEWAVKDTVTVLASAGRLNPGEGNVPNRTEKIAGAVIAFALAGLSILFRTKYGAPASLPEKERVALTGPLRSDMDEMQSALKEMQSAVAALKEKDAEIGALTNQLIQKDARLLIAEARIPGLEKQLEEARRSPAVAAGLEGARTINDEVDRTRSMGADWIGS